MGGNPRAAVRLLEGAGDGFNFLLPGLNAREGDQRDIMHGRDFQRLPCSQDISPAIQVRAPALALCKMGVSHRHSRFPF